MGPVWIVGAEGGYHGRKQNTDKRISPCRLDRYSSGAGSGCCADLRYAGDGHAQAMGRPDLG